MERSTNNANVKGQKKTITKEDVKIDPGQILEAVFKEWKLMKKDFQKALQVTQPTALKLITNPQLMDGQQRKALALFLNLDIDVVDDVINGSYHSSDQFIDKWSVPPRMQK